MLLRTDSARSKWPLLTMRRPTWCWRKCPLQRKQLDKDGDGQFGFELASGGFRGFNMSATGPARDHAAGDVQR